MSEASLHDFIENTELNFLVDSTDLLIKTPQSKNLNYEEWNSLVMQVKRNIAAGQSTLEGFTAVLSEITQLYAQHSALNSLVENNASRIEAVEGAIEDIEGVIEDTAVMCSSKDGTVSHSAVEDCGGVGSIAIGAEAYAVGTYNVSIGYDANTFSGSLEHPTTSTGKSVAIGYRASASKHSSVALGGDANAHSVCGIAIGFGASARSNTYNATCQTAVGTSANASGVESTALGNRAAASGAYGVSVGTQSAASSANSIAIGHQAKSKGGIAIGHLADASLINETPCIALGPSTLASGQYSNVLSVGFGTYADDSNRFVLGAWNAPRSSALPALFAVGDGTSDGKRHNALTLTEDYKLFLADKQVATIDAVYSKDEADEAFMTQDEVDTRISELIDAANNEDTIKNVKSLVDYVNQNASDIGELVNDVTTLKNTYVGKRYSSTGGEVFNDYTYNKAIGFRSHAEGSQTQAIADNAHAEGYQTQAKNNNCHAEGGATIASGNSAHAQNSYTVASGDFSHAGGSKSEALGDYSFAHGIRAIAKAKNSYALGADVTVEGQHAAAIGNEVRANGNESLALGYGTLTRGAHAFAGGVHTVAEGENGFAFGDGERATGYWNINSIDRASRTFTVLSGPVALAVGTHVLFKSGDFEFVSKIVAKPHSYAFNISDAFPNEYLGTGSVCVYSPTVAEGKSSFASGTGVKATVANQVVFGKHNIEDNEALFVIGNGTAEAPSNAFTIDNDGNAYVGNGGKLATFADADYLAHYNYRVQQLTADLVPIKEEDQIAYSVIGKMGVAMLPISGFDPLLFEGGVFCEYPYIFMHPKTKGTQNIESAAPASYVVVAKGVTCIEAVSSSLGKLDLTLFTKGIPFPTLTYYCSPVVLVQKGRAEELRSMTNWSDCTIEEVETW